MSSNTGVHKHRNFPRCPLHLGEHLGVRRGTSGEAGDAQGIGQSGKNGCLGEVHDVPLSQIRRRFRHDVEEQLHVLRAYAGAVAGGLSDVGVPQPKITGIHPGENLPDKGRSGSCREVDGRNSIPQHIDAKRAGNICLQLANDAGHCDRGNGFSLRQVGKAEFIREHDGVNAAGLQRI